MFRVQPALPQNPVIDVLKKARMQITNPDNWIQGVPKQGNRVCASRAVDNAAIENKKFIVCGATSSQ